MVMSEKAQEIDQSGKEAFGKNIEFWKSLFSCLLDEALFSPQVIDIVAL